MEVFSGYWEIPFNRLGSDSDNDEILNFQYLLALYFWDATNVGIDFKKLGELKNLNVLGVPMEANDEDLLKMGNLKNIKALIFDRGPYIKGNFLKKMPKDSKLMAIKTFEFNFPMENIAKLSELENFLYFECMGYAEMEKFGGKIDFQLVLNKQQIAEFVRNTKIVKSKIIERDF